MLRPQFEAEVPTVTVIHSDQAGDRFVQQRIAKCFEGAVKNPDLRGGILVCSHAAVLGMPPPITAAEYSLYFDEMPDCSSFEPRSVVVFEGNPAIPHPALACHSYRVAAPAGCNRH
jgi:hypothetical protein